mgnify:CR=1 FL=1
MTAEGDPSFRVGSVDEMYILGRTFASLGDRLRQGLDLRCQGGTAGASALQDPDNDREHSLRRPASIFGIARAIHKVQPDPRLARGGSKDLGRSVYNPSGQVARSTPFVQADEVHLKDRHRLINPFLECGRFSIQLFRALVVLGPLRYWLLREA